MTKVLKITWQRLVDKRGQTCSRCGSTEVEIQKAFQSLKKSLVPLGIKVVLEKKALDVATCAKDISQSNRIWVGGRPLEEWLNAQVGQSLCETCCEKLGSDVECRTVEIEGEVYETISAGLIIRASLLAAAELIKTEAPDASCCPPKAEKPSKGKSCCP